MADRERLCAQMEPDLRRGPAKQGSRRVQLLVRLLVALKVSGVKRLVVLGLLLLLVRLLVLGLMLLILLLLLLLLVL